MCLAQNNDVIQTLAPDRSDQPFGKAVLHSESIEALVPLGAKKVPAHL
jgi:hypothetical protein